MSVVRPDLPVGLPAAWQRRLHIDKRGCWRWSGAHRRHRKGTCPQPLVSHRGRVVALVRVLVAAVTGAPINSVSVVMSCRAGWRCVNPAHAQPRIGWREKRALELAARRAERVSWIPGVPYVVAKHIEPIPVTGCWLWTGSVNPVNGYGHLHLRDRDRRASVNWAPHRLVYTLLRCSGSRLPRRVHIHHCERECIGKLCCNPDHLSAKDAASHARDHRIAEMAEGRGWHSEQARQKRRLNYRSRQRVKTGPLAGRSQQYKGVSAQSGSSRWRAYIYVNAKQKWLGLHESPVAAALAHDAGASEHFGEFAWLNRDHFDEVATAYAARLAADQQESEAAA